MKSRSFEFTRDLAAFCSLLRQRTVTRKAWVQSEPQGAWTKQETSSYSMTTGKLLGGPSVVNHSSGQAPPHFIMVISDGATRMPGIHPFGMLAFLGRMLECQVTSPDQEHQRYNGAYIQPIPCGSDLGSDGVEVSRAVWSACAPTVATD